MVKDDLPLAGEWKGGGVYPKTIRLLLVIEFLVGLIAVLTTWGQVAGPDSFELVPWFLKLLLGAGLAFTLVQATAAAMKEENPWNARTMAWLVTTLALMIAIGAVTHYYQLYEPAGEEEDTVMQQTHLGAAISINPAGGLS